MFFWGKGLLSEGLGLTLKKGFFRRTFIICEQRARRHCHVTSQQALRSDTADALILTNGAEIASWIIHSLIEIFLT